MTLWAPSNLATGPVNWWDAQDTATYTPNGSNQVLAWANKGSSGFNATAANAGVAPVYSATSVNGFPGLSGNATTRRMTFGTGSLGSALGSITCNNSLTIWRVVLGGLARSSGAVTTMTAPSILGSVWDATSIRLYQNGNLTGTITGLTNTSSGSSFIATDLNTSGGAAFGRWIDDGNLFNAATNDRGLDGAVGELLTFTTALSATDRQLMEGYTAWRWGLQAGLPGGHPFASAAPTLPATGTVAATEAADTAAATAVVLVSGTAAATDSADTAASSGQVLIGATGSPIETADTLIAAGIVLTGVTGMVAVTEAPDSFAAAGTVSIDAAAAATEAADTGNLAGAVLVSGSLAQTDVADTASAAGVVDGETPDLVLAPQRLLYAAADSRLILVDADPRAISVEADARRIEVASDARSITVNADARFLNASSQGHIMKTYPLPKDPQDVANYSVGWAGILASGDTIATQTVTKISGAATIVSDTKDATSLNSIVRVSGGAVGETLQFLVHIVTTNADEFDQTCAVKIKAR